MVRSLWIEYMYISASLPSYALHFTVKHFPIHATLISECFKNVLFTSLKPCQDSQPKLISSHKHAYQPSLKRLWATLPLANRLKLSFLGLEGEVHFLDTNDRFDAFALKWRIIQHFSSHTETVYASFICCVCSLLIEY